MPKALTVINAGEGKVFSPGDDVSGLDEEAMQQLFEAHAIGDEYEAAPLLDEYPTTPRVVRDSLRAQARSADGPKSDPTRGTLTQPKQDAPDDPGSLLVSSEERARLDEEKKSEQKSQSQTQKPQARKS